MCMCVYESVWWSREGGEGGRGEGGGGSVSECTLFQAILLTEMQKRKATIENLYNNNIFVAKLNRVITTKNTKKYNNIIHVVAANILNSALA